LTVGVEPVLMYDDVLVATDGTDGSARAVDHALAVADRFDATVHALYAVDTQVVAADPEGFGEAGTVRAALRREGERATADLVERAEATGVAARAVVREAATPRRAIVGYAREEGVDLVAMGTHGRSGIRRILLGSTAESVVRTSPSPVMTVRSGGESCDPGEYADLLVPTDGGPESAAAAGHALGLAEAYDARVHALSVVDTGLSRSPPLLSSLETLGKEAVQNVSVRGARRGVEVVTAVEEGSPHEEVLEYADREGVDLIAMGTHGRTGLDRFVTRSVADRVVRAADPPVVTVRSEDGGDGNGGSGGDPEREEVAGGDGASAVDEGGGGDGER
jgi:nucleotide-binding universal stress UspA family protein